MSEFKDNLRPESLQIKSKNVAAEVEEEGELPEAHSSSSNKKQRQITPSLTAIMVPESIYDDYETDSNFSDDDDDLQDTTTNDELQKSEMDMFDQIEVNMDDSLKGDFVDFSDLSLDKMSQITPNEVRQRLNDVVRRFNTDFATRRVRLQKRAEREATRI